MSEEKREELLDELLVSSRKMLSASKAVSYKPTKYEVNKVNQIIETLQEISKVQKSLLWEQPEKNYLIML